MRQGFTMGFLSSSLLPIALLCFLEVSGQTTQTVQVGLEGSFFDPSYVVAQVDDIVSFVFSGNIHSVTQSTFENPCIALPGGFNSGLAGKGTNSTAPVPVWNLRITDASRPIWYFCQATIPSSHCAAGMVGVINPPNATLVSQFQSSARAVSGTPAPSFAVTLSGVGAFATASPSDVSTMLPLSSRAGSSSAPAATRSVAPSPGLRVTSNIGAIVGGAVGGTLCLILALIALLWVLRQRKLEKRSTKSPREDIALTPKRRPQHLNLLSNRIIDPEIPTPTRPDMSTPRSAVFSPTRTRPERHSNFGVPPQASRSTVFSQTETLPERQSNIPSRTPRSTVFSQTGTLPERQSNVPSQTPRSTVYSQTGTPPEREQQSNVPFQASRSTLFSHTGTPQEPQSNFNLQSQTPRSATFSRTRTLSEPQSNIDIQALAQEVAVVLRQNPGLTGGLNVDNAEPPVSRVTKGTRLEFHAGDMDDHEQDDAYGGMHPAPPHYRPVAGPSEEGLSP